MQNRSVEVFDGVDDFDGFLADFVGLADVGAGFDAAFGEENGRAFGGRIEARTCSARSFKQRFHVLLVKLELRSVASA